MSSSAASRKRTADPAPFPYADAGSNRAAEAGQTEEERIRREQAAWFEQGRQAGQQQLRAELDSALAQVREQSGRAIHEFAAERQSYYRRIEGEVVALALAIARKILHRESQLDPHLLCGIVRVTLEKLDAGTRVAVRVHPKEAAEWRHYFACQAGDGPAPEVHEDAAILPGECRVETSLGTAEIGIGPQLKEIETGLLDLLAERPGAPADGGAL